jgi:hypothetical protein
MPSPIQFKITTVDLNATQTLYRIFIRPKTTSTDWQGATFADFVRISAQADFSWELSRQLAGQRGGAYYLESGVINKPTDPFVLVTTLSHKLDWPEPACTGLFRTQFRSNMNKYIRAYNSGFWDSRVIIPNPWLEPAYQFDHAKSFFQKADATMLRKFWKHVGRNAVAYLKRHKVLFMQTDGSILRYMLLMMRTSSLTYNCSACTSPARVQDLISIPV